MYVTDGALESFWTGITNPGEDEWVCVDLGKTCDIGTIVVSFFTFDGFHYPLVRWIFSTPCWVDRFKISVSTDGEEWQEIISLKQEIPESGIDSGQVFEFPVPPTPARYIKVHNIHGNWNMERTWCTHDGFWQGTAYAFEYAFLNELEVYEWKNDF